jgi:hypothetical protein
MERARVKRTIIQQLLNPPFNRSFAELGGLTDDQLLFLYAVERGPDGVMEVRESPLPAPSAKAAHERRCFLLGIDRAKWAGLWAEEKQRRKAAQAAAGGRKGV